MPLISRREFGKAAIVFIGGFLAACSRVVNLLGPDNNLEPEEFESPTEEARTGDNSEPFELTIEPSGKILAQVGSRVKIGWNVPAGAETYDIELNGSLMVEHHPASEFEIGFGERDVPFIEGLNTVRVLARAENGQHWSEPNSIEVVPVGGIRARHFDHEDDGEISLTTPAENAGLIVGRRFGYGKGGKGVSLWASGPNGSRAYKNLRQLPVESCWIRLAVFPESWALAGSDVTLARIRAADSRATERIIWRTGEHIRSSNISGEIVLPQQKWAQVQLGVDVAGNVEVWYFDGGREYLVGKGKNAGLAGKVKDVVSIGNDSNSSGSAYNVWLDEFAVGRSRLPWASEDNEHALERPKRLSTEDLPPVFSFVFGADNVSSRVPYQNTALAAAAAANPNFVVHLGDFGYPDTGAYRQSKAGYLAFWTDLLYEENLRSLFQKPWIYIASDHDLGGNNVDSTTLSSWALEAYSEWQNNDAAVDGIGRYGSVKFDQGRVELVWLDEISQRSPTEMPDGPTKTSLGNEQKKWLLDLISTSHASLLIIASQGSVGHADVTTWYSYQSELAEILGALSVRQGNTRILSGDHHSARYAKFAPNVAEWGAAPFAEIAQGEPDPSPFTQDSVVVTRRRLRGEGEGVAIRNLVLAEMSEDEINAITSFGRVEIDTIQKSATFQVLDSKGLVRADPNGETMQETLFYG